ncbi:hypothetical protein TrVE_jg5842 [Triparma verrucosa]|uniref:Uncharacterized protein n=1 Tax=Triparma verrucosa TaxID=1606542 RepID=A0A9W7EZU9_9STRA|nr:hypothetical protein TrVE_jg5842 [Triparma verrucosa]
MEQEDLHSLLVHLSNLSRQVTNLTAHCRSLGLENSRLKATIRSSSLLQKTAFSNNESPTTTVSQLLSDCLAREEMLSSEVGSLSKSHQSNNNPPPPPIDYYASIYTENVRLRTALKSSQQNSSKQKYLICKLRSKVDDNISSVLLCKKLKDENHALALKLSSEIKLRKKLQQDFNNARISHSNQKSSFSSSIKSLSSKLSDLTRSKKALELKYAMYVEKITRSFEIIKSRNEFLETLGNNHMQLGMLRSLGEEGSLGGRSGRSGGSGGSGGDF